MFLDEFGSYWMWFKIKNKPCVYVQITIKKCLCKKISMFNKFAYIYG
jgi:hypothetical protein